MKRVLAVDLGGTKTAAAVVDERGVIARKTKTPAAHSLDQTVEQIAAAAMETDADGAGVIVPGIYDGRHGTAWAPNLWGSDPVPLRGKLDERLRMPVSIASDRTGYVLGEQWLGAAQGLRDVLFVAVGTGIGVGIVCGGRVVEGAHGIAGAAGWMAIAPQWKPEYASLGCWEAEAAGPAVARRGGAASAEAVVAAARQGDTHALAILEQTADSLAMGVANLISLFDPEMVVLGGGLMQAGDLLLPRIRETVPRWAQPVTSKLTGIELTRLGEDAGLFGAGRLALLNLLEQRSGS